MRFIFILVFLFSAFAFAQESEVFVKVGEAKVKKSLIAFPPLQYTGTPGGSNFQSVGSELYRTVFNDLNSIGYFQFIDSKAFLEDTSKTALIPIPASPKGFKWESWKSIGAEFLIRAGYSISGKEITFETYTYNISKNELVMGKKYKSPIASVQKMAHTFANDLVKSLTGKEGMFLSKLVFSSDRGGGKYREIYVMDWDGENIQKITNHRGVALSPSWSPDGKKVAYSAFVRRVKSKKENVDLFVYEFKNGNRWQVSYREGINSGSAWMPDGKSILLTISQGSNPDIFQIGMNGGLIKRLTSGPRGSMNVEPAI
ncbi:MAG: translocation protein TolB, partial [Pseudobdellovibrionaceae bacterium]